jgi:hypothetical protein
MKDNYLKSVYGIRFIIYLINKFSAVLAVFILLISYNGFSQVSNYAFSETTSTYTALSTSTNIFPATWDDNAVASVTIPFTFVFNGVDYTSCNVATNGFITFGSTTPANDLYSPISTNTGYAGAVSGFGRDLISNSSAIVYGIEGISPNRVFVVQWVNARRYDGVAVAGDVLNFQIRLHETSNLVQVKYGSNNATNSANDKKGQIGLRGASNTDFNNRTGGNNTAWNSLSTGTDNNDKVNFKASVLPATGLTFNWGPPPIITSLGSTSGCAGSSIIINGKNLAGATASDVKVGGTSVSSITSNSGTTIVAVLGSGTTGNVTVSTSYGVATSTSTFTVNPLPTDIAISSLVFPTGADACSRDYTKFDASGGLYSNVTAFSENFSGSPVWAYTSVPGMQAYYYAFNTSGGTAPEGALARVSTANNSWSFYPSTATFNYLPIDISNFTTLNLYFKHFFSRSAGSHTRGIYVDVSTNSTSWTNVWSVTPIGSNINATAVNINLSAYVGATTLYFRFRYTGDAGGMNYWTMDDILLSGNKEIITWTPTTGLFTNATLTTPYTGTNTKTVYAAPSSTTIYTATSDLVGCSKNAQVTAYNERKVFTGAISSDWNTAGNWNPSGVPTSVNCVTIPSAAVINTPADSKSMLISSSGDLKINAGNSITVVDALTVQSGGLFTLEDGASLVQDGTTNTNTGIITTKRNAKPMKRYDFTYWSSPVAGQTFFNLSPTTFYDKFYSWNTATQAWVAHLYGAVTMTPAQGYIVRAPQTYPTATVNPTNFEGKFIGVPNSGDISINVVGSTTTAKWNLIGNPYPSAVSLDEFLSDSFNSSKIYGTIYLWSHNSPPSDAIPGSYTYNYTSHDYAAYNGVGGTATSAATTDPLHPITNPSPNTNVPNGYLASGQSFFVRGRLNTASTVKFTNSMRERTGNDQFFRIANLVNETNTIQKSRYWLNIRNSEGAFNQTLIGYVGGATNELDEEFDGELLGGNFVTIYSLVSDTKLTIQGRALPFENSDVVPLGIKTTISGNFSISLDMFDGLFEGQDIFLKDKFLNTVHDLKTGGYAFASGIGTFENRFEIVYQNESLGVTNPEFNPNSILIYKKDKTIVVNAGISIIDNLQIFDIQGRLLYDGKNINSSEHIVKNLPPADQVLIVQIQVLKGAKTSKKIIY